MADDIDHVDWNRLRKLRQNGLSIRGQARCTCGRLISDPCEKCQALWDRHFDLFEKAIRTLQGKEPLDEDE